MEIKEIDDIQLLINFVRQRENVVNLLDEGCEYQINPRVLYVGVFEGPQLVGVFEVSQFWQSSIEIHPIFSLAFRGRYAIAATKDFLRWMLARFEFTSLVTSVPDHARQGAVAVLAVGGERVGVLKSAYRRNGKKVSVTFYQLEREKIGVSDGKAK